VAASRLLRVGSLCALLYVIVFIGGQAFLSWQEQITTNPKQSLELREQAVLRYWHLHTDLITYGAAIWVIGYLLLAVVACAVFLPLRARRPGLARLALAIGLVGMAVSIVAAIVQGVELASLADRFYHATTAATRQAVTNEYENAPAYFVVLYIVGAEAIAVWLGLIGLIFVLSDRSSAAGWGSIAVCVLQGLGLPVLVAWALGAAIGLWRLSGTGSTWITALRPGRFAQLVMPRANLGATNEDSPVLAQPAGVAAEGSKEQAAQARSATSEVSSSTYIGQRPTTGAARRRRRKR
jgi:hypothetical protein